MNLNNLLKKCGDNDDDNFNDVHIYIGDTHFWYSPKHKSWMQVFKYTRGNNITDLLSPIIKSQKITDKEFSKKLNSIIEFSIK